MSEEDNTPKQKLVAGSQSSNVQVGRDYHHHEAPRQSLLHRPTQEDVEKFDPKFRRVRQAADREVRSAPHSADRLLRHHKYQASGLGFMVIILVVLFLLALVF